MEVSARAWLKDPITPSTKYENSNAACGFVPSGVRDGDFMRCMTESTGVTSCGKHGNEYETTEGPQEWMRKLLRSLKKKAWKNS